MKKHFYRFLSHISFGKIAQKAKRRYHMEKDKQNFLQNCIVCIGKNLNDIQEKIKNFEIYETGGEWFKDNFDEYLSQDLTDKYMAMLKNLDEESKWIFDVILQRLLIAKSNDWNNTYFHASAKEKIELQKIQDNLYNRIIPLGNGWYSYKTFLIPSNDLEPGIWYYNHFIKEIENLDKVKTGNIIDAGGYIGDSALVLSDYTDKKVYSFEPLPKSIELMNKLIKKNKNSKIVPIMKGLGNKDDTMYMPNIVSMGNVLSSKDSSGIAVEVTTLDKFVKENNLEVSCLKVDIEGFERYLLEGAMETIKLQKPVLIISIYHNGHDLFEIKPWIENLNLGYKFKIRKAWDHNTCRDTVLICEVR